MENPFYCRQNEKLPPFLHRFWPNRKINGLFSDTSPFTRRKNVIPYDGWPVDERATDEPLYAVLCVANRHISKKTGLNTVFVLCECDLVDILFGHFHPAASPSPPPSLLTPNARASVDKSELGFKLQAIGIVSNVTAWGNIGDFSLSNVSSLRTSDPQTLGKFHFPFVECA